MQRRGCEGHETPGGTQASGDNNATASVASRTARKSVGEDKGGKDEEKRRDEKQKHKQRQRQNVGGY